MYTILTILSFLQLCEHNDLVKWHDVLLFTETKYRNHNLTVYAKNLFPISTSYKGHKAEKHLQLAATYSGVLCEKVIQN